MTQPDPAPLYAAVEAGGTKFVVAVGHGHDRVLKSARIDTRDPAYTLGETARFLSAAQAELGPVAGLGVATFGPVRLDPAAADFGRLLATPKPGWDSVNLVEPLVEALGCRAALDTDVNAAALAEARAGAGRGCDSVVYVTIGTGIGAGIVVGGRPVHGMMHPEAGHLMVRRHPDDAGFAGICPYHGDCCEGLACGPAIAARSGRAAEDLPHDHPHWAIVADAVGQLCASLALTVSPQRILLGGGVMTSGALFPAVRAATARSLNGYLVPLREHGALERLIMPPELDNPGLAGAFLLAAQ
ncbi:MAG: ROK family protein [Sphingomonadales bacterium]|nr:ROK family protein [Sphingomonadales bacterium]